MASGVRGTTDTGRAIEPFTLHVSDEVLADLAGRLARTRWIEEIADGGWKHGASIEYFRTLASYWRNEFDWRAFEAAVNCFPQFTTVIDCRTVHFVHERGRGPNPMPIVLTHGFPDSFLRFQKLIPMLTDPKRFGGDAADSFDVIVPSLPGYAFSDSFDRDGEFFHTGDVWHELMVDALGYSRFAAHGGDWGSTITELMARDHADAVIGIHLTDVPFFHALRPPDDPSPAEKKYLETVGAFTQSEGAYAAIQGATPQALSLGLNDSPVGLAAWLIEKFRRWSDCGGDVEKSFTKDELLGNVTLYWVTGTINTSFAPYYDVAHIGAIGWLGQMLKQWVGSSDVPAAFAMFPKDLSHPPREFAKRFFNVQRWSEMPSGGHFAALEEPERLAADIREFFRALR